MRVEQRIKRNPPAIFNQHYNHQHHLESGTEHLGMAQGQQSTGCSHWRRQQGRGQRRGQGLPGRKKIGCRKSETVKNTKLTSSSVSFSGEDGHLTTCPPVSGSVSVAVKNQSSGNKWNTTILTLSSKTDTFQPENFSSSWFVHLNQCWAKFDGIIDANYSIEQ